MQKSDKYFLAKKDYIPGCEKPTNQSPITLAKRMWQNELKLAPELGDFVVDTVEDEEIEGFKGVRCVERAYIVDVKLRQPVDEKAIALVGLPFMQSFSTSAQNDEGRLVVRNFEWAKVAKCKTDSKTHRKVSLQDYEHVSCMEFAAG